MLSRSCFLLLTVCLFAVCVSTPIFAAPAYEVIDLNASLPGSLVSQGLGINNNGDVVGTMNIIFDGDLGCNHAFLYHEGHVKDLAIASPEFSIAHAINDYGQVTGMTFIGQDMHMFMYTGGKIQGLDAISKGRFIDDNGRAINNSSEIAGVSAWPDGTRAVLYSHGIATDLGTLGGNSSAATAINDAGQITGWSTDDHFREHAFLYRGNKMLDLGTLPGGMHSAGFAINNVGQITGYADTNGGNRHAFLYTNGRMLDIGTLPGFPHSEGHAINRIGQIVGNVQLTCGVAAKAFFYSDGKMQDLNSLISRKSGWILTQALGINDKGQIVGYGVHHGAPTAFLLNPHL